MSPGYAAIAARNVRLGYAFRFLMDFGFWVGIWIKYLTSVRELELQYIFLMDMPFWLVMASLEAPFGALADRIGHSRVLAFGAAVHALTILGFGFTTNYWMLFADYMLWAIAGACRSGADQALIYDSLKQAGLESTFSRVAGRGFAITVAAGTSGVILGGILATVTSLAFTVQVSCLGPALACFIALAMVEPHVEHAPRRYIDHLVDGVTFAWREPRVRYTVLLSALIMMATFAPIVLVQPFLIEHDVATGLFGVYQAPLRIATVIAAVLAHRVALRAGDRAVLATACWGLVLGFLALALFDTRPAFVFFALPAVIQGIVRPTLDAYLNGHIPSDRRATVLSTSSLVLSVGLAFFEPTIGFIIDGISLPAACAFVAIFFAITMPGSYLLWRRHDAPMPAVQPLA